MEKERLFFCTTWGGARANRTLEAAVSLAADDERYARVQLLTLEVGQTWNDPDGDIWERVQ